MIDCSSCGACVLLLVALLSGSLSVVEGQSGAIVDGRVSIAALPVYVPSLAAICVDSTDYLYVLSALTVLVYDPHLSVAWQLNLTSSLRRPADVLVNSGGDVYVADVGLSAVLLFDSEGSLLFTYNGSGAGSDGRPLNPVAVAFDLQGHLLVVDRSNARVVVLDLGSGNVIRYITTPDSATPLSQPSGLAVDSTGIIYVCDTSNGRIVLFSAYGTEVVGVWDADRHLHPTAITIDTSSNVYVSSNNRTIIYNTQGAVLWTRTWSNSTVNKEAVSSTGQLFVADNTQGTVNSIQNLILPGTLLHTITGDFQAPKAVSVQRSNPPTVYLTDSASGYVQLWSMDGRYLMTFNASSRLEQIWGVAISNQSGVINVYAVDRQLNAVMRYDAGGALLNTISGNNMNFPQSVAVDDRAQLLYIGESFGALWVFDVRGSYKGYVPGLSLTCLTAVAVSPVNSNVYLADGTGGTITVLNRQWNLLHTFNGFSWPNGLAVDECNNIYVLNANTNQLLVLDYLGRRLRAISHSFGWPTGVAVDQYQRIYVADTNNNRVVVMHGLTCTNTNNDSSAVSAVHNNLPNRTTTSTRTTTEEELGAVE